MSLNTEHLKDIEMQIKLKQEKRIGVLSIDNENKGEITKILRVFEKKSYFNITEDIGFRNYDLILINNNAEYDINKINEILENNPDILFLYYGEVSAKRGLKNVNFSNSIFTLYGNLMNTLKAQDLLSK